MTTTSETIRATLARDLAAERIQAAKHRQDAADYGHLRAASLGRLALALQRIAELEAAMEAAPK